MKRRGKNGVCGNWAEKLPVELTQCVFRQLDDTEILCSVQFVCRSWLHICRDPQMWRTVKLRNPQKNPTDNTKEPDRRPFFEAICRCAVDYGCGQLIDITIDGFGTADLLNYITDRSSQIKRLQIRRCYNISDKALGEAVAKLPLLEELELFRGCFSVESLKAVGQCCPGLKTLKFNCLGREFCAYLNSYTEEIISKHAFPIAKNFPGLRHLELVGDDLADAGLRAILDGCPHLESLNLRYCFNVRMAGDLRERCRKKIKFLLVPYDGVSEYSEEFECEFSRAWGFRSELEKYTSMFP